MSDFSITVLNPGGTDAAQSFSDYAGEPGSAHAPVNFHGYAACTAGNFETDAVAAIRLQRPILMLIRRDMKAGLRAIEKINASRLPVAVALKESGSHQFSYQVDSAKQLALLKKILGLADAVISPTEALIPVYRALRPGKPPESVCFLPTPYPFDDPRWDFSIPFDQRRGIFIGTREFKTMSRNHLAGLIVISGLAKRLEQNVSVINVDGRQTDLMLNELDLECQVETVMDYTDYLRCMAGHRVVFQLDQSMVPGQVAGDAGLCRSVAVGGNGSIDEILFPDFSARGQDRLEILAKTEQLLVDDDYYLNALQAAEEDSLKINFSNSRERLETLFQSIPCLRD